MLLHIQYTARKLDLIEDWMSKKRKKGEKGERREGTFLCITDILWTYRRERRMENKYCNLGDCDKKKKLRNPPHPFTSLQASLPPDVYLHCASLYIRIPYRDISHPWYLYRRKINCEPEIPIQKYLAPCFQESAQNPGNLYPPYMLKICVCSLYDASSCLYVLSYVVCVLQIELHTNQLIKSGCYLRYLTLSTHRPKRPAIFHWLLRLLCFPGSTSIRNPDKTGQSEKYFMLMLLAARWSDQALKFSDRNWPSYFLSPFFLLPSPLFFFVLFRRYQTPWSLPSQLK